MQAEEVDKTQNLVLEVEIIEDDGEKEPEPEDQPDEIQPVEVNMKRKMKTKLNPSLLRNPRRSRLNSMSTLRCKSRRTTSRNLPPSHHRRNPSRSNNQLNLTLT